MRRTNDHEREGLGALFRPRSIAVVGASGQPGSPYARPLEYLQRIGFDGPVYPVNPRYEEIAGQRCYRSLADVPAPVDLVMVLVAARMAEGIVREAAAAGGRMVIICSSGFAEMGSDGAVLEQQLLLAARETNVRVVGPNSQGVFYLGTALAATFTGAAAVGFPTHGGAAYVGQSGAIGGVVLDLARESGMGLTAWVSTGNDVDVTAQEVACDLIEDLDVRVLMLYLEALPDGAAYRTLAARSRELGKHLVVLRSGKSAAGRRAVTSHTGAIVGPDHAFELVSESCGVVLVDDVDEFVRTSHALLALPLPTGNRVGIVTTSGGAGALAADSCTKLRLAVDPLPAQTRNSLARLVPEFGAVGNPVDVTVQLLTRPDNSFQDVCATLAASPEVDSVLILATSPMGKLGERLAEQITSVTRSHDKPVLTAWMAGVDQTAAGRDVFRAAGLPLYDSPSQAAQVLRKLVSRAAAEQSVHLSPVRARPLILPPLPHRSLLMEVEGKALLDAAGIARPKSILVTDAGAAADAVIAVGGTAVMKIQTPRAPHKTDIGGVRVGVNVEGASDAFTQLNELLADDPDALGILVQEMVPADVELVLGVTTSSSGFPPLLTVGFGGIATELYADVASAVLPVDHDTARRLILSLLAAPLLTGYRGRHALDVESAADAAVRLGELALAVGPSLAELEINPLVVSQTGVYAVDFLLRRTLEDAHYG